MQRASGIPCALCFEGGEEYKQTSGAMRRENAKAHPFFSVIPGRAQREPGIHRAAELVDQWIPGLRQVAHPGMTAVDLYAPSRRVYPAISNPAFA